MSLVRLRSLSLMIVTMLIVSLTIPACSSQKPEAKKPAPTTQKPKAPPELKDILTDLDKIIAAADQKLKMREPSTLQKNTKLAPESKTGQEQEKGEAQKDEAAGREGQKKSKPEASERGKPGGKPPAKEKSPDWKVEETSLKNIHKSWNTLEPEAIRAGLAATARDSFEMSLDNLTSQISQQRAEGTLMAAIELYGAYADLVQVFNTPIPPEFFRVKHEAMAAAAQAGRGEWPPAGEHIITAREHWDHLKIQAEKIDAKLVNQTEFSLQDLEQAIQAERADLVTIKSEILMQNLQKLEQEFSRQQGHVSSSG